MPNPHELCARQVLELALSPYGLAQAEAPIPAPDEQFADVAFLPTTAGPVRDPLPLGLLGRIASRPCLLEPFSRAPGAPTLEALLRKVFNARHGARGEGAPPHARALSEATLWALAAGRPNDLIEAATLVAMTDEVPGVYVPIARLPVGLVVIPELPSGEDTLLLRLLGRGAEARAAREEVRQRQEEHPRWRALGSVVIQYLRRIQVEAPAAEEEEDMDEIAEEAARWEAAAVARGRVEGRVEGRALTLAHLIERRLVRPLTASEREALSSALHDEATCDRVESLVLDPDPTALSGWLSALAQ